MSIIDTANHNVTPYISGTTKPFTGQRLIAVTYKTVTDKASAMYNIKRESKAVSVPLITDTEISDNIAVLIPHIRNMLEETQKKIVRELLDASNNVLSIASNDIALPAIVEYLESSDESGRLTKESVSKWFSENIEDTLMLALAEKLGISDVPSAQEAAKIDAIVGAFKRDISSLAGGKTNFPVQVATQLKKCIAYAPENDVLASKFSARLDGMINKKVEYIDCL